MGILFLVLSAEFLDPAIKKHTQFNEYFEKINQKLKGDQLTQKKSIIKLNEARISFKHHGVLPHPSDIELYRIVSKIFFEEYTSVVFGIDFREISFN